MPYVYLVVNKNGEISTVWDPTNDKLPKTKAGQRIIGEPIKLSVDKLEANTRLPRDEELAIKKQLDLIKKEYNRGQYGHKLNKLRSNVMGEIKSRGPVGTDTQEKIAAEDEIRSKARVGKFSKEFRRDQLEKGDAKAKSEFDQQRSQLLSQIQPSGPEFEKQKLRDLIAKEPASKEHTKYLERMAKKAEVMAKKAEAKAGINTALKKAEADRMELTERQYKFDQKAANLRTAEKAKDFKRYWNQHFEAQVKDESPIKHKAINNSVSKIEKIVTRSPGNVKEIVAELESIKKVSRTLSQRIKASSAYQSFANAISKFSAAISSLGFGTKTSMTFSGPIPTAPSVPEKKSPLEKAPLVSERRQSLPHISSGELEAKDSHDKPKRRNSTPGP